MNGKTVTGAENNLSQSHWFYLV